MKLTENQLAFDIFTTPTNTPGNCPHEQNTVDIGGGKSLCELLGAWTNCRCVGHCVYEQIRKR